MFCGRVANYSLKLNVKLKVGATMISKPLIIDVTNKKNNVLVGNILTGYTDYVWKPQWSPPAIEPYYSRLFVCQNAVALTHQRASIIEDRRYVLCLLDMYMEICAFLSTIKMQN